MSDLLVSTLIIKSSLAPTRIIMSFGSPRKKNKDRDDNMEVDNEPEEELKVGKEHRIRKIKMTKI